MLNYICWRHSIRSLAIFILVSLVAALAFQLARPTTVTSDQVSLLGLAAPRELVAGQLYAVMAMIEHKSGVAMRLEVCGEERCSFTGFMHTLDESGLYRGRIGFLNVGIPGEYTVSALIYNVRPREYKLLATHTWTVKVD